MGAVKNKWEQLKTNGYGVREKEKRINKEKRGRKEERENKEKIWYGITSIGQNTEGIKGILKKEGFNIFRKGGEKLKTKVNKKKEGSKRQRIKKNMGFTRQNVKIAIKYTQGKQNSILRKRIKHMKDVEFKKNKQFYR